MNNESLGPWVPNEDFEKRKQPCEYHPVQSIRTPDPFTFYVETKQKAGTFNL
jgi:hypothetical protein